MSGHGKPKLGADAPSVLLSALAAIIVCACRGHDPAVTHYVNVATGSDTNPGTANSPFKTIAKALRVAKNGDVVQVAPGTYSQASGEVFPLRVPDGVLLQGDEFDEGAGSTRTAIVGGGLVSRNFTSMGFTATLDPGQGSTIAGFTITNDDPINAGRYAVFVGADQHATTGGLVRHDNVTIRNNTMTGALHSAAIAFTGEGADRHVVVENRLVDNIGGAGLQFGRGGLASKVEGNVITGNLYGVAFESPGGDLGGGTTGSLGGNVMSCNTQDVVVVVAPWNEELWSDYPPNAVPAANGFWDHVPPVACLQPCALGCDICISAPREVVVTTAGAKSAPSVCP